MKYLNLAAESNGIQPAMLCRLRSDNGTSGGLVNSVEEIAFNIRRINNLDMFFSYHETFLLHLPYKAI